MSRKEEFEFLGPYLGPTVITFFVPLCCYALVYACNSEGCLELAHPLQSIPGFAKGTELASVSGFKAVLGWICLLVLLHLLLPGKHVKGVLIANSKALDYKLNSFWLFCLLFPTAVYLSFGAGLLNLSWIYDNYVPLVTASWVTSTLLAIGLYLASFQKGRYLAPKGATGYRLYDFYMGRELNPRIGSFDLKEFCELYPGLMGWILIDLGMAHKQYQMLGYVTPALIMVCCFHAIYVLDGLWNEASILTTMDITSDGFGYMLAFGDLTWVPFIYTVQARYLVDYPQDHSTLALIGLVAINALGHLIFRGSNSQKDKFRRNPNDKAVSQLKTLKTERGTSLIISGWWGIARHINYFGDWILGWSYCLPCGFRHIIPYFYVTYFGVLLVHRDLRDGEACKEKYGKDWDKYCAIVKYRIVPFLY